MAKRPRLTDSLASLRARATELEEENRQLRHELEQVRSSTSFRLGHAVVRTAARIAPGRRSRPLESPRPRSGSPATPEVAPTAGATAATTAAGEPWPEEATERETPSSLLPGVGPGQPEALLLDATGVAPATAQVALDTLLARGHRVTVVHPDPEGLDLDADRVTSHAADGVAGELAARFGPEGTLRLVALADGQPAALRRDARPLVQVVDEGGSAEGLPPGPVFIGGTGRSGTWVLGRMLAAHPRVATVHTELRFHASPPGYAKVLAGELSPADYAELVHSKWFRPKGGSGNAKGLQLLSGNRELRRSLQRFLERAEDDVPGALGQLMLDVVEPYARGRGAIRWVETTPDNASAAAALTTSLPSARVVHVVRDGRDVAASVVTMPWGPDTHLEGLDWWARRLRAADRSMGEADPGRVHTLRLEELLNLDRERTLQGLLDALGYTDDEDVRAYFAHEMDGRRGNVGRWRGELDAAERDAFEGRYREVLAELRDEGVTGLPAEPEAVDQLAEP